MEEKMQDLKFKSIRRFLVVNVTLMMLAFILPYIMPYIYPEIPQIYVLAISSIMMILLMISYCVILIRLRSVIKGIVSPAELLAEKMMRCKLRIENGLDYCVKCPDSYRCASDISK